MPSMNELREQARAVCADPKSISRERRDAIEPFRQAVRDLIDTQGPSDRANPGAEAALRFDLLAFEKAAALKEAEEERDDPTFVHSTPDDLAYLKRSERDA